ncbi:MAG: hypothetical protein Q8R37_04540 [Nanoarchaeota archaeon]|nr:hypothetical protein [Nanoarchaeota archaeon]
MESVYLVREFKEKTPFPLQENLLEEVFAEFSVSESELQSINNAITLISPTIEEVKALLQKQSSLYETINLQRTIQLLKEIPLVLVNNARYLERIQQWQATSPAAMASLLNKIPALRAAHEKMQTNQQIKDLFAFLLRNQQFMFLAQDIVHEGPVAQINGLAESMEKGFFFHISLEEEYNKISFDTLKSRIPPAELEKFTVIEQNIKLIKKAVDAAYQANMRQVNLAVVLYSYVKWLTQK